MRKDISTVPYPNIMSFLKRHGLTIGDLAKAINKSYPATHQKLAKKKTKNGKANLFDIEDASAIIDFVVATERHYLQAHYPDTWEAEWEARWGHIQDWFKYLFFDRLVTNVTKTA